MGRAGVACDAGGVTTSPGTDHASVEHRLITMRKAIGQLESLGPLSGERLGNDTTAGLVVERILALLADLAFAINCEVSRSGRPETVAASFSVAGAAGLVDADVVSALTPVEGPHHVLMQLSLDAEPDEAAVVVAGALAGYSEYVRQVTAWLARG